MVIIRSVIALCIGGLGVVALADGRTVTGVLLLGLAAMNVALTVTMTRRRREWRERIAARRAATGAGAAAGPWRRP
jgi:hypothetical protein